MRVHPTDGIEVLLVTSERCRKLIAAVRGVVPRKVYGWSPGTNEGLWYPCAVFDILDWKPELEEEF